ncbi:MAG: hypothetical protein AAFY06_00060 [Pseudomonadota bacterium]
MKFQSDPEHAQAFGLIGATVPWIIAVMPFIWAATQKKKISKKWTLTTGTAVAGIIWVVFIGYASMNTVGAMSNIRTQVQSENIHTSDTIDRAKFARSEAAKELEMLPVVRPPNTLAEKLRIAEQKKAWRWTRKCTRTKGKYQRRYCRRIADLKAEIAIGDKREKLVAKIEALDTELNKTGARRGAEDGRDPAVKLFASLTGGGEETTEIVFILATPIVLQFGSMTLLAFSLMFFGVTHQDLATPLRASHDAAVEASPPAPLLAAPAPITPSERDRLSRGRQLAEYFFTQCTRPAIAGTLKETEWWDHYSRVCERSKDVPLPLSDFREVARTHVPEIVEIRGVTYYRQMLPFVDE